MLGVLPFTFMPCPRSHRVNIQVTVMGNTAEECPRRVQVMATVLGVTNTQMKSRLQLENPENPLK